MTRSLALLAALTVLAFAGCGGSDQSAAPNELEAADVNAAISRIVKSCTGAEIGSYDQFNRREDVARVVEVYRASDPNARFQLAEGAESTTMQQLVAETQRLLARTSNVTCSTDAANDLETALKDG